MFKIGLYQKNIYFEANQNGDKSECSRLEQRSVIKFLVADKCKPCEIYRRMCDVYWEACFSQKSLKNGLNYQIVFKMKMGHAGPQRWTHLKWWISVNTLILADNRVSIEGISVKLGIFVGTAHKIIHDDLCLF